MAVVTAQVQPAIQTLPNATSGDYDAMSGYWTMIEHMLAGPDAMRRKDIAKRWLPQFPNESTADYDYRRENAVFTNIYTDIVNNLASKPFAEECKVDESAAEVFQTLSEDIDGRGNSLHVFAAESFFWGLNMAIDWILVDYPKAQRPAGRRLTIADERQQNLRPYWIHVAAPRMLAVYSDMINGKELYTHARIGETLKQRDGFGEKVIERVRVFDREPIVNEFDRVIGYAPATFELWEKVTRSGGRGETSAWESIDSGPITIGVIPIVPFITGKRIEGSWVIVPPMRDCAYCQIEHFQAETALKSIKELTAYPMLSGNGVTPPPTGSQNVGPRVILYAPPYGETGQHGNWTFVEPGGTSLTFLAKEIERLEMQMRELGRQPLTAQTGNLTVVTTAFAAQKGNSAVQAWALNLKDALEQAFVLTSQWINQESAAPTVSVFTDFAIEMGDDQGPSMLQSARNSGDLSQLTYWEEMQRRNILSKDFDPDEEKKRLEDEAQPLPSEADKLAALALVQQQPPSNNQQQQAA